FGFTEKLSVDPRVRPLLLTPPLFLEAGNIDGVDLLLHYQAVIDFRLGIERELMRLVRGDVERVDGAALSGVFRNHAAVKFLAQPAIDMRGQFHSWRGEGLDRGAKARQRVNERMNGAAALEVAGNGDLHIAQV